MAPLPPIDSKLPKYLMSIRNVQYLSGFTKLLHFSITIVVSCGGVATCMQQSPCRDDSDGNTVYALLFSLWGDR